MPEKISILKESGELLNSNIVSIFMIPETGKKYIITTENTVDPHGLTVLHVSEIVEDTLVKVATDEEWSSIKTIMRAIISGNVGSYQYLPLIEKASVRGQYSRDISVSSSAATQMVDNYVAGDKNAVAPVVQPVSNGIFPAENVVPTEENEVSPGIAEVQPEESVPTTPVVEPAPVEEVPVDMQSAPVTPVTPVTPEVPMAPIAEVQPVVEETVPVVENAPISPVPVENPVENVVNDVVSIEPSSIDDVNTALAQAMQPSEVPVSATSVAPVVEPATVENVAPVVEQPVVEPVNEVPVINTPVSEVPDLTQPKTLDSQIVQTSEPVSIALPTQEVIENNSNTAAEVVPVENINIPVTMDNNVSYQQVQPVVMNQSIPQGQIVQPTVDAMQNPVVQTASGVSLNFGAVPNFNPNATLDEVVAGAQEIFIEGVKNLVQSMTEKVYRDLYQKENELKERENLLNEREKMLNEQMMAMMNNNQVNQPANVQIENANPGTETSVPNSDGQIPTTI